MHACQLYGGGLCRTPASHNLLAPDGTGWYPLCEVHAMQHIEEYREKLGEEWSAALIAGAALDGQKGET